MYIDFTMWIMCKTWTQIMLILHKGELMSHHIYSKDCEIHNWRENRAKINSLQKSSQKGKCQNNEVNGGCQYKKEPLTPAICQYAKNLPKSNPTATLYQNSIILTAWMEEHGNLIKPCRTTGRPFPNCSLFRDFRVTAVQQGVRLCKAR